MSASLVISRTALSLADLTVASTPLSSTYLLMLEGVARPDIAWRTTYATDSPYTHGSELVAAVRQQANLPTKLMVQAASASALDVACVALEDALSQFSYTVTQTVEGIAKVWSAGPADWSTGPWDSGVAADFFQIYAITIPVYPIAGS